MKYFSLSRNAVAAVCLFQPLSLVDAVDLKARAFLSLQHRVVLGQFRVAFLVGTLRSWGLMCL
jgi:hypothetical protein